MAILIAHEAERARACLCVCQGDGSLFLFVCCCFSLCAEILTCVRQLGADAFLLGKSVTYEAVFINRFICTRKKKNKTTEKKPRVISKDTFFSSLAILVFYFVCSLQKKPPCRKLTDL